LHRNICFECLSTARPGDDLERAVVPLGDGRAALDPVAAIDVAQAEIVV